MKKKNHERGKQRLISIGIVFLLVLLTLGAYGLMAFRNGQLAVPAILLLVCIFAVVIVVYYIRNKYCELEKGYPLQDERSKRVMLVAAAKAYLLSIWYLVILIWLSDNILQFRDPAQALSMGILGMAILLGVTWLWYRKKEDIEEVTF